MSSPVRIGALVGIGAVALGAVVFLSGGLGGRTLDGGPGASPTPAPPTASPSPSSSPSVGTTTTYTTTGEPRLAIDLTKEWLVAEQGGEIRLSYLGEDLTNSSVTLVRLDRASVIEPGGGTAAVPDDLMAWIAGHPNIRVTRTEEVAIAGARVPAQWVTGRYVQEEPQTEHSLMTTGADRELSIGSGAAAWFAVVDGLAVDVLVHVPDADAAAVDRAIAVLQTLRDAGQ